MANVAHEVNKLVSYIESLTAFKMTTRGPSSSYPADAHIGAIIVDATLQARHDYYMQVEPRVRYIRNKYPQAATTSGFLFLIGSVGIEELLMGWEKNKAKKAKQKQAIDTAKFFDKEGIQTYTDLAEWFGKKGNRDRLKEIHGIGNKTADYYGVLVGHPDAVAVDERISTFLENAGINGKYGYNKKKTVVQAAAIQMGIRPIDLEQSIWHYNPKKKKNTGGGGMLKMRRTTANHPIKRPAAGCWFPLRDAKQFAQKQGGVVWLEARRIDKLPPIAGTVYNKKGGFYLNTARRGTFIILFKRHSIYDQFKENWKGGNDPACAEYLKECRKAAKEYDKLAKSKQPSKNKYLL